MTDSGSATVADDGRRQAAMPFILITVLIDMVSIGIMGFLSDRLIVFIESKVLVWRMLQSH